MSKHDDAVLSLGGEMLSKADELRAELSEYRTIKNIMLALDNEPRRARSFINHALRHVTIGDLEKWEDKQG